MSRANSIRLTSLVLALGGIAGVSYGQQVLSAQSGTVHHIEGPVFVDGRQIQPKPGQFATLRPGEELRTEGGRAEVLLTPGAFLRVADHSTVRMIDNRLSDTRVEVLEGSVIVECDALLKDNAITLLYAGNTIHLDKHGLYRVDTVPPELRVYDGEATVQSASGEVLTVKRGKETALNGVLIAEKFNRKLGDGFYLWDADRSALLAAASVNASQSLLNNKSPWTASGWCWSPYYDMFTFVPRGGSIYSPFGWQFWSPSVMAIYYTPYGSYRGSNGNGGQSSGGSTITSGIASSSGSGARGGFGGGGASSGSSGGFGGGGGGARGSGGGGGAAGVPAGGGHSGGNPR